MSDKTSLEQLEMPLAFRAGIIFGMRKILILVLAILAQMETQYPSGELRPIDQRLDRQDPMTGSDLQGRDPGVAPEIPAEERMEEESRSSETLNDDSVPENQLQLFDPAF